MATEQGVFCHQCGQPVASSARFCGSCGTPKHAVAASSQTAVPPRIAAVRSQSLQNNAWLIAALVAGLFIFSIVALILIWPDRSPGRVVVQIPTVDEYLETERVKLNELLAQPANPLAKEVEKLHHTVTYKRGQVKTIRASTIDGSNSAGVNGSNISDVSIVVRAQWDGYIQKDGWTEILLVFNQRTDQMSRVQYLNSNSVVNPETKKAFEDGWKIGASMAALFSVLSQ